MLIFSEDTAVIIANPCHITIQGQGLVVKQAARCYLKTNITDYLYPRAYMSVVVRLRKSIWFVTRVSKLIDVSVAHAYALQPHSGSHRHPAVCTEVHYQAHVDKDYFSAHLTNW